MDYMTPKRSRSVNVFTEKNLSIKTLQDNFILEQILFIIHFPFQFHIDQPFKDHRKNHADQNSISK